MKIFKSFVTFTLICFAALSTAQAVTPPPDGGYTVWNTAEGQDALFSLTNGSFNTAIGGHALYSNTEGTGNTAVGAFSLAANSSGDENVAIGQGALRLNTGGDDNTATGFKALYSNTFGSDNTATGFQALYSNTNGNNNTATGSGALQGNATGDFNTATGFRALFRNTNGAFNTAVGETALFNNSTGLANTAVGERALLSNTKGDDNTAVGEGALLANKTGESNTAIGTSALSGNITGSSNIALGASAGGNLTIGSNNIYIGSDGLNSQSNTIRIGTAQTRTFIKGISGAVVVGAQVVVNAEGQLGVAGSSARFKTEIKPMDKASEAILSLKPVTFRYKKEIDAERAPQFGLVAEQVEEVDPGLVTRDQQGKPYSVRYEAVNAMLLNEFLKEHRKVQELETNAAQQQKQIEALTAGLQKVSTQLELRKAAPQTVLNNQ